MVIDRLVDLITSSNPSLFNAVGYQAAFARYCTLLKCNIAYSVVRVRFTLFWPQRLTSMMEDSLFRGANQVKLDAVAKIQINK